LITYEKTHVNYSKNTTKNHVSRRHDEHDRLKAEQ